MCNDEPRIVDLMVVDLLSNITEVSFYIESIDLVVVALHVYVLWVASPNVCRPLKYINIMLMNLLYGNIG